MILLLLLLPDPSFDSPPAQIDPPTLAHDLTPTPASITATSHALYLNLFLLILLLPKLLLLNLQVVSNGRHEWSQTNYPWSQDNVWILRGVDWCLQIYFALWLLNDLYPWWWGAEKDGHQLFQPAGRESLVHHPSGSGDCSRFISYIYPVKINCSPHRKNYRVLNIKYSPYRNNYLVLQSIL